MECYAVRRQHVCDGTSHFGCSINKVQYSLSFAALDCHTLEHLYK